MRLHAQVTQGQGVLVSPLWLHPCGVYLRTVTRTCTHTLHLMRPRSSHGVRHVIKQQTAVVTVEQPRVDCVQGHELLIQQERVHRVTGQAWADGVRHLQHRRGNGVHTRVTSSGTAPWRVTFLTVDGASPVFLLVTVGRRQCDTGCALEGARVGTWRRQQRQRGQAAAVHRLRRRLWWRRWRHLTRRRQCHCKDTSAEGRRGVVHPRHVEHGVGVQRHGGGCIGGAVTDTRVHIVPLQRWRHRRRRR